MNRAAAKAYNSTRAKEGRLLKDAIVQDLPFSGSLTAQAPEWRVRERSMLRLLKHFARSGSELRVLEIGCGNGWLSARVTEAGHVVTAMDIHSEELDQARRVFTGSGIDWQLGDPMEHVFPAGSFDRIVFAASLQYFADVPLLFAHIRPWLSLKGEVHVVDSVLYPNRQAAMLAQERSVAYFAKLGTPEMARFYHHHTKDEIMQCGSSLVLSSPSHWDWSRFPPRRLHDPFHHTVHTFRS